MVLLDHADNLCLVEENDGVEGRHHVLFKQGGRGEDHFLDVLDPEKMVDRTGEGEEK